MARQPDTNSVFSELARGHVVGAPGEPPFESGFRDIFPEYQVGPEAVSGLLFSRVGAFLLIAGWWGLDPVAEFDPALPIFTLPDTLIPRRGFYLPQKDGPPRDLYFETDGRVRLAGTAPTDAFELGAIFTVNGVVPLFH